MSRDTLCHHSRQPNRGYRPVRVVCRGNSESIPIRWMNSPCVWRRKEGAQLAIAWMLAQPAVTSCIVGAKTPEQATYNAAAAEWALSESDLAEISGILGDFLLTV